MLFGTLFVLACIGLIGFAGSLMWGTMVQAQNWAGVLIVPTIFVGIMTVMQ